MAEYAVWFDKDADQARRVQVVSRGAHASRVAYRANGLDWQVFVSNDDIEFDGEYTLDDDED
jgi:hypothetical protein